MIDKNIKHFRKANGRLSLHRGICVITNMEVML